MNSKLNIFLLFLYWTIHTADHKAKKRLVSKNLYIMVDDPIDTFFKIKLSPQQIEQIAYKIWTNECGKTNEEKLRNLMHWSQHEQHISIGIMHFTWSSSNKSHDRNQFHLLRNYIQQHTSKKLPKSLSGPCPWKTREDFLKSAHSPLIVQLKEYLLETIPLQAQFLISHRFKQSLKKMYELGTREQFEHVRMQFYRMLQSPGGLFALIDTLNLSGEKGLFNTLIQMNGTELNEHALEEYIQARINRFHYLVKNDPKLEVFLQGWINRVHRYRED